MNKVYMVKEITFDSFENRLSMAINKNNVGIFPTKKWAESVIERVKERDDKYEGWDGETYPKYEIEELKLYEEGETPNNE